MDFYIFFSKPCALRPRRAPGWDDRELPHERVGDEAQGDTGGGNPIGGEGARQACGHCACACQADDVWAAYRVSKGKAG